MDYQEKDQQSSDARLSLSDIFQVVKQKWLIIGLVTVVLFALGYLYVKAQPDTYSAQSTYIVYAKDVPSDDDSLLGEDIISSLSSADISRGKSFKILYVEDLRSNNTLPNAIRMWLVAAYGYSFAEVPSAGSIRSSLSFSTDEESYFFFTASVRSANKKLVMDMNAALADVISGSYKNAYEYKVLLAAISGIAPLGDNATDAEKAAFVELLKENDIVCEDAAAFSKDLAALNTRITIDDTNRDRFLNYTKYDSTPIEGSMIYPRDASETPRASSASSSLAFFAAIVGFILSTAVFVIIKVFDTKIRNEEDLRKHCPYPTLAIIPAMHIRSHKGGNRS